MQHGLWLNKTALLTTDLNDDLRVLSDSRINGATRYDQIRIEDFRGRYEFGSMVGKLREWDIR